MAEAKIHPPSPSRVAEARAAGFAPRPLLVGLSAASFALAALLRLWGPSVSAELSRLLREPLASFERGQGALALGIAAPLLAQLAQKLALCAMAVAASVGLALLLTQGAVFVLPRRSRQRFVAPKHSFEALGLAALSLLALCAFQLVDALWLVPSALPELAVRFLSRLAGVWLALALVDAAFARAQFFRALWLTRRELREEQREAYGSPELRAARAALRQTLFRSRADPRASTTREPP